jgi:hypothetical protein
MVGAALIGIIALHRKITAKNVSGVKISLFLIHTLAVLSIAYCLIMGVYPDIKRMLGYCLVLLSGTALFFAIKSEILASILAKVILIHIIFFYIQFFCFYVLGIRIDFLEPITGEAQRTYFDDIELPILSTIFRACGLYNEPGTYANHLAFLTAIFSYLKSATIRHSLTFYSAIISLVLSFSAFGIVFSAIILLASKASKLLALSIFVSVSPFVNKYIEYRFFEKPDSGLDSGLGIRADFLSYVLQMFTEDPILFIFGVGFFNTSIEQEMNFAVNDLGLLFYVFYAGGIISLCVSILILTPIFVISNRSQRAVLIMLALSKISVFTLYFSLILVFFLKSREGRARCVE